MLKSSNNHNSRLYRFCPFIILSAVMVCYGATFQYAFHFDDHPYIIKNTHIHDLHNLAAIWSFNPGRFLTFLSLSFNHHLGEFHVFSYHLFNTAIHAANALLVFWIARLLMRFVGAGENRRDLAPWFPLLTAMLFACHPLQTGAVVYIWQRAATLSAFFYLLCLMLYLRAALCRSRPLLYGSLAAAYAAAFTKQSAVTLPVAILMMEFFFISRSFERLKKKAAQLAAFAPALILPLALAAVGASHELSELENRQTPFSQYLLTQFNVIATYLRLAVAPVGQNLDYDYPLAASFADAGASALLLLALALLGLRLFSKNRIASFGIFFFFLSLSVESLVPLEDLIFEHRMYLPLTGILLLICSPLVMQTPGTCARVGMILLAFSLVPLIYLTHERNKVWRTEETLWRDVVEKSPAKERGYANLGLFHLRKGDPEKALSWYLLGASQNPDSAYFMYMMARVLEQMGEADKALSRYSKAAALNPQEPLFWLHMAEIYDRKGDVDSAMANYTASINARPEKPLPHALLRLAELLDKAGSFEEAERRYHQTLRIVPHEAEVNYKLGMLYKKMGNEAEAAKFLGKAAAKKN